MNLHVSQLQGRARREQASVLVIVLWISIGLVCITLYFANSMTYEYQAADNRVDGMIADQTIEGAARYVSYQLLNYATNGAVPDNTQIHCEAVPIGDAKFWIIGRDLNNNNATEPYFGLVDEGGKMNLNNIGTNTLQYLPNMTYDLAQAIQDWRGTNGVVSLDYTSLGYQPKYAPFETVDELKLVYGMTGSLLVGEDVNRNGVLDPGEKDLNGNGEVDPGLLEYTTVYTREPNFHSDGTTLTNVNTIRASEMRTLLQNAGISTSYAGSLMATNANARPYAGLFAFALECKTLGVSTAEFNNLVGEITTTTNLYFRNRVNVNTASVDVLSALFMGRNVDESTAQSAAQQMVTYRQQNPQNLNSVAWVVDALGNNSPVVRALRGGDYITTRSYQFTADIAAVGPYGRGYRRVKFVFDMSDGSPKIIYRQDLSRLGWALGDKARQSLLAKNTQ